MLSCFKRANKNEPPCCREVNIFDDWRRLHEPNFHVPAATHIASHGLVAVAWFIYMCKLEELSTPTGPVYVQNGFHLQTVCVFHAICLWWLVFGAGPRLVQNGNPAKLNICYCNFICAQNHRVLFCVFALNMSIKMLGFFWLTWRFLEGT